MAEEYPRLMHRGHERAVANTSEEGARLKKQGYELHHDPKHKTREAREAERQQLSGEISQPEPVENNDTRVTPAGERAPHTPQFTREEVHDENVEALKERIIAIDDVKALEGLRKVEATNPNFEGGRQSLLKAIDAKIEALKQ